MIKYRYYRPDGSSNEVLNIEDIPEGLPYDIIEFDPNPPPAKPNPKTNKNNIVFNFDGYETVFRISHELGWVPDYIAITVSDETNSNFNQSIKSVDENDIIITCNDAPVSGSITVWWSAAII